MGEVCENEVLQKIRDVFDSSIDESNVQHNLSSENEGRPSWVRRVETIQASDEYIDVEDYCKFLKDCGEQALASAPLDSRTLITPHQAKQDSQQMAHSLSDFHNRIESFDVARWSQKPDCVSAFECARYGWKLTEWGFLSCVTCKQILHVPSTVSKYKGIDWAIRLRKSMESSGHLSTCPWTRIPSPADILALPKGDAVQKYLTESVSSFRKMRNYPNVDSIYQQIMAELDLNWVRDLTSSAQQHYDILDEGATQEMMRDMALLLVLSGWKYREDDSIHCTLCLRQVSLALFYENQEIPLESLDTSVNSSFSSSAGSRRTFNPVRNHWCWCPWRRFLLDKVYISPSKKTDDEESLEVSMTNLNADPVEKCDISDYHRLLEMFREQYDNLQLKFQQKSNTSGHELLSSISALMDEFLSDRDSSLQKSSSFSDSPVSAVAGSDDSVRTGSKREHPADGEEGVPAKRSRPL